MSHETREHHQTDAEARRDEGKPDGKAGGGKGGSGKGRR